MKNRGQKCYVKECQFPMIDLVIPCGNFGIKCKYPIYSYPYMERLLRDTQEELF